MLSECGFILNKRPSVMGAVFDLVCVPLEKDGESKEKVFFGKVKSL